jgi:hypothetical protein
MSDPHVSLEQIERTILLETLSDLNDSLRLYHAVVTVPKSAAEAMSTRELRAVVEAMRRRVTLLAEQ